MLDICGGNGVYLPTTECDDCAAFLSRMERAEDKIYYLEVDKQDKLTAGTGIHIIGDTIYADGASYIGGAGITINDTTISADRNPSNTYTKAEVDALLGDLEHLRMEVVNALPTTGESNVIYLVPRTAPATGYEQYVWASNQWVDLGEEDVDLSEYLKATNIAVTSPITKTVSGNNVTISHDNSGVTAGSKGDTTNQTPAFGATFKAMSATVDSKGHVTAIGEHTVKIPNSKATSSADGLMSKEDKAKLDGYTTTTITMTATDGTTASVTVVKA